MAHHFYKKGKDHKDLEPYVIQFIEVMGTADKNI